MVKDLEERCSDILKKPVVLLSSLLDPRYKELLHIKESHRKNVLDLMKEEIINFQVFLDKKADIFKKSTNFTKVLKNKNFSHCF